MVVNKKLLFGLALLAVGSLIGLLLANRFQDRLPGGTARPAFGDVLAVGAETGLHRVFVRSTSGSVEFAPPADDGAPVDADFRPVTPGMFLGRRTLIRTGADSSTVLQFGNSATARIEPNTQLEVVGEAFRSGEVLVTLHVATGEVLARALDLGPHERLRILSPQAVTTIESGSLMVRSTSDDTGGSTRIAVADGVSRVLPGSVDPERLALIVGDRGFSRAVQDMQRRAGRVEEGNELLLGDGQIPDASQVLKEVQRQVERAAGAGELISRGELQRISAVMDFAGRSLDELRPRTEPISGTESTRIRGLREPDERTFAAASSGSHAPATVRIETDPSDAEIYLEGLPIGKRIYSALFLDDERPVFEVRRRGYESQRIAISFDEDRDQVVQVSLARMEPELSTQEFMEAAATGRVEAVQRYIETGGDVNAIDADGLNALARALGLPAFARGRVGAFQPHTELIAALLEAGIEVRLPYYVDGRRFFALHLPVLASLAGADADLDLIRLLLGSGASVDSYLETEEMSVTPLGAAVIVGLESGAVDYELVELLLEHGADPNAGLVYERRVLDVLSAAVVMGAYTGHSDADLVRMLLRSGARRDLRFRIDGVIGTPLQFAERLELEEIAQVLRSELAVR